MDAVLRTRHAAGVDRQEIADELSAHDRRITAEAVRARLNQFGFRIASPREAYWTPERDARLTELWSRQPRLTVNDIRELLGDGVSMQWVSARARVLQLPSRRVDAGKERFKRTAKEERKMLDSRSPIPGGGKLHGGITTPAPRRVHMPLKTPCPFYHPMEMKGPCGVMVDRRPGHLGIKPSQYCEAHEARVLPIERGTLGTLAIFGVGVRFYK